MYLGFLLKWISLNLEFIDGILVAFIELVNFPLLDFIEAVCVHEEAHLPEQVMVVYRRAAQFTH